MTMTTTKPLLKKKLLPKLIALALGGAFFEQDQRGAERENPADDGRESVHRGEVVMDDGGGSAEGRRVLQTLDDGRDDGASHPT